MQNKRVSVTIELPWEFVVQCNHDQIKPETVLRGFIADLCAIVSEVRSPREDRYCSNGSDERDLARAYYERVGYRYWRGAP